MPSPRTLVLASGNPGKIREFQQLLEPAWRVVPQSAFQVSPADETGTTFLENALIKARHAADVTGRPALADDSGLEVDALGGAPGVYSARFAGPGACDADNNTRLLEALAGVPKSRRGARYRCVLVYVGGPADPAPLIAEGTWSGWIGQQPDGDGGFGYDPLFVDQASGISAARLSSTEKNARSHRGIALHRLKVMLDALVAPKKP